MYVNASKFLTSWAKITPNYPMKKCFIFFSVRQNETINNNILWLSHRVILHYKDLKFRFI